ncbi:Chromate resistance protein ChrB [Actinomadura fulvescens]|uniref:ChrB N-terminal domain-containing protein n=1 Tax=Actinomadura fulvescens TaxID=46160 RepID=A0ABP6CVP6_9ACTN
MLARDKPGEWVLLSYRLPREPSTPRISVWRKLRRLGVAQISDGLVALPADARTREHLEWIADEVTDAGGNATIWLARPTSALQERELTKQMAATRAEEYDTVKRQAADAAETTRSGSAERQAAVRRLRAELRRIGRRDYFPPPEREQARTAVQALVGHDTAEQVHAREETA